MIFLCLPGGYQKSFNIEFIHFYLVLLNDRELHSIAFVIFLPASAGFFMEQIWHLKPTAGVRSSARGQ